MDLRSQLQDNLGSAYQLERELGGGGMSRVFVAHEHRLSRKVVVKVLAPELVEGLNAERFEREILLAASLQQANIVPVLAAGEVGGLPYFIMPFIEGESLRNRLTGSGLPISDVLAILRDVSRALAYAHSRGIVHRDIKPDNVLLSGGTAVVTDFGIAKALSASRTGGAGATLTSIGTSIGTPAYMAPEQAAGDPDIDHRADLYALGCVAFELLTGRSPFADRTPQKMLAAHLSEHAPAVETIRTDCPPTLALLVARLLEKDPGDRVESAEKVFAALMDVGTDTSPTASLSPRGRFLRAIGIYVLSFAAVVILTKAAIVGIGLPDWTLTGAIGVMLLGLPALLFTGWAKTMSARAVPTLTPGGSVTAPGTMTNLAVRANRHLSWKRTARAGMLTMGAFVLLVSGFMVTRAMGVGPAASLFATGALEEQDRVLLADLAVAPQDSALATIVVEAVRAAMSQTNAIRLLEPSEVADVLEEMRRERSTRIDPSIAAEVAQRAGVHAILGGRFTSVSNGYAVSLELTTADGGSILTSLQSTTSEDRLLETVDDLTRKLRSKLGESLRQVQRSVPLARATTSSLAALRKFSEASHANDVERDFESAIRLGREAVALDSTFALAWRKLAISMWNAQYAVAPTDSALEQSLRYVDRLPPLERQIVLGSFYQWHSTRVDWNKALEAYRAAFRVDPTNALAIQALRDEYSSRQVYDSAIALARRDVELRPGVPQRLHLVRYLTVDDQFDEAGAILDSIAVESPAAAATGAYLFVALQLALRQGDSERALLFSQHMSRLSQPTFRATGLEALSNLELARGHLAASLEALASRARLLAERDRFDDTQLMEADRNIRFRDRKELGVRQLSAMIAGRGWTGIPAAERPYWNVIVAYSDAGRPDLGRRILGDWRRDTPDRFTNEWWRSVINHVEGSLALAEGNAALAVEKYRAAFRHPDGTEAGNLGLNLVGLGRAYDLAGQVDSVVAVYQRFLALPGDKRHEAGADAEGLALIRKRLGEIYESRGDTAAAIGQYAALVDQWSDADAELQPVVASMRTRIRELGGMEGN